MRRNSPKQYTRVIEIPYIIYIYIIKRIRIKQNVRADVNPIIERP